MKKKDKTPPALSPELEAAVGQIDAAIKAAEPFVLATEQNTYEALVAIYDAVLPFVDLAEPDGRGLRLATAQPALLAYYADNGCKVREGDNLFGPAVKLGFAPGLKRTPNAIYAKFIAAGIELGPKSPHEMKRDFGSMEAGIEEWETCGGGYKRSKLAKAAAAAAPAADPHRPSDITEAIAALEESEAIRIMLARRILAAEKRAEEADTRAKEYKAKWDAAEAALAELREPLPATGTALVLYAPPKRKRGRPRKQPVAMAAE